ncbi:hypothetical protein PENSPDRAFT_238078 [Peniophora sp. CONT]|nr:hypothetical protein PENSPDRAFT_238078 [Peniophora sp. CONT]
MWLDAAFTLRPCFATQLVASYSSTRWVSCIRCSSSSKSFARLLHRSVPRTGSLSSSMPTRGRPPSFCDQWYLLPRRHNTLSAMSGLVLRERSRVRRVLSVGIDCPATHPVVHVTSFRRIHRPYAPACLGLNSRDTLLYTLGMNHLGRMFMRASEDWAIRERD